MYPVIFEGRPVDDLVLLHCMLFATQYSTARSWIDSGLEIDTLVGHSFGQVSTWCISGSLSLKEALKLVSGRARLLQDRNTGDTGLMLSVEGDAKDVHRVVREVNAGPTTCIDIACYNGPRSFVLAGDSPSIESVEHNQLARNLKLRRLESTHAYHSYMLDDIMAELASLAESIDIRDPVLRVEPCQSPTEAIASPLDHDAITCATRQPVYFAGAVQRIADRLPTAIWLEAGSASPIISMAQRALGSASQRPLDIFLPSNLSSTTTDLVHSTCEMWKRGSSARYWLFHASNTYKFTYLSLPHYQFDKTPHWITHRPLTEEILLRPGVKPESPHDKMEDTLITKISGNEASSDDVFAVNTLDPTFDLVIRGHMVAGYGICPASFYIELASRCALSALPKDSILKVPRVESLTMSASLSILIDRKVYVRLVGTHSSENAWDFQIVSCGLSGMNELCHAKGRIGLAAVEDITTSSRLRLIKRMAVDMQSVHQLEATPYTSSISGPIVYKLFSQVVEYADYYRGVQSVSARENKAVGIVKAPLEQIPGLISSASDPVSLDNFLQVAGIHVNCLGNRSSGDVFMCTSIDEVNFFGPGVPRSGKSPYWTVYSANSTCEDSTVVNDIFVFESDSTTLIMVVMGATFKRVPFSSIIRSQGRAARGNTTMEGNQKRSIAIRNDSSTSSIEPVSNSSPRIQGLSDTSNTSVESLEPNQDVGDETNEGLQQIRRMLSDLVEVPLECIQWTSTLEELGIDSLMINELATEVRKRFNLGLASSELQTLENVQALYLLIFKDDMAEPSPKVQAEDCTARTSTPDIEADDLKPKAEPSFAAAGHRRFHKIRGDFSKFAEQTCLKGFASKVIPRQIELVLAYIIEAFASLDCDIASLREGDHVPAVSHMPKHGKLVARLQMILKAQNLLKYGENGYLRTRTPVTKVPASVLYERLLIDFPEHVSETRLLHSTAHQLAECLRGSVDPISILFGDAEARALIGDVYTNAPIFKTATEFLSEFLEGVLGAWGRSHGRSIHILELGGGTGGTTRFLVEHLAALGLRLTYTFSDVSTSLVTAARSRFAGFQFMKYEVLDVEKSPAAHHSGHYDVIISTNCIHATKSLVRSLTNVRNMLRPDGMLCLVELTKNLDWFDLVFGLLEGWWLFDDGRQHALADEHQWNRALRSAGFHNVDWSDDAEPESDIIRLIVASPFSPPSQVGLCETVVYKTVDGLDLFADLYYPRIEVQSGTSLPVALMIHGGGHVMLSRADVRPEQTKLLVDRGFIAVSIDYRLCPETTLTEGPMEDVADALQWARTVLPEMKLKQGSDAIRADGSMVAAIGWSTGGFLALSLGWTSLSRNIEPPNAILAFYSPCDYEDEFWARPNIPHGTEESHSRLSQRVDWDIRDGLYDAPITSYNVTGGRAVTGGWLAPDDARSRIALYMNWSGKTLHVLLNGMAANGMVTPPATGPGVELSPPTRTQIEAVSLPFHVKEGRYQSPTFLIHPRLDDLIPWQQAQNAYNLIQEAGVEAELRVLENVGHLFDINPDYEQASPSAGQAVMDGYDFISRHVGLG
jgi:acetyl esterase/lipase/acyl carrier protein